MKHLKLLVLIVAAVAGLLPCSPVKSSVVQSRTLQYTNTTIPAGNTVTGTTAETFYTSQYSMAVPVVGETVWITGSGMYSSTLLASSVVKFYLGSTQILATPSMSAVASASNYGFDYWVKVKVMPGGKILANGQITWNTGTTTSMAIDFSQTAPVTFNWTTPQAIRVSATQGGIGMSSTENDFTVEAAYPQGNG